MNKTFKKGQVVHIDIDSDDWGRIASDATVIEDSGVNEQTVFLRVEQVRADMYVCKSQCKYPMSIPFGLKDRPAVDNSAKNLLTLPTESRMVHA
jgi:hypothetical protein